MPASQFYFLFGGSGWAPIFRVKKQKRLMACKAEIEMKQLNQYVQNWKDLRNRLHRWWEIATRTLPPNQHSYAICCRPEAADDIISVILKTFCDGGVGGHTTTSSLPQCWLHHFTTSQSMYPKLCSIDTFVNLQPFGWNMTDGLFYLLVWGQRREVRDGPFDSPSMGSYISSLVCLLPYWVI